MSNLSLVSTILVAAVLVVVLFRAFGKGGIKRLAPLESREELLPGRLRPALSAEYKELWNLADLEPNPGETVLAACGRRGELEMVLMATNQRLFFLSRRFGASHYANNVIDYAKLHPIPVSQCRIGERIRIIEGDRITEMISPGAESWLDTAEDTIKIINSCIKKARTAQV